MCQIHPGLFKAKIQLQRIEKFGVEERWLKCPRYKIGVGNFRVGISCDQFKEVGQVRMM